MKRTPNQYLSMVENAARFLLINNHHPVKDSGDVCLDISFSNIFILGESGNYRAFPTPKKGMTHLVCFLSVRVNLRNGDGIIGAHLGRWKYPKRGRKALKNYNVIFVQALIYPIINDIVCYSSPRAVWGNRAGGGIFEGIDGHTPGTMFLKNSFAGEEQDVQPEDVFILTAEFQDNWEPIYGFSGLDYKGGFLPYEENKKDFRAVGHLKDHPGALFNY